MFDQRKEMKKCLKETSPNIPTSRNVKRNTSKKATRIAVFQGKKLRAEPGQQLTRNRVGAKKAGADKAKRKITVPLVRAARKK